MGYELDKFQSMKSVVYIFYFLMALTHISCGQTTQLVKPLKETINNSNSTNATKYLNQTEWNELFPHRYGIGLKDSINNNPDFYSFKIFVIAAKLFPAFLSEGDGNTQKRELAAFLANLAQETSGGWQDAPGGYFKWGLYFFRRK